MNEDLNTFAATWAEAERHGDVTTLDTMLTDDFVGIGPFGFLLTREQWLTRYTAGDLVHKEFSWTDVQVHRYGSTAITIGVQTQQSAYQGRPVDARFRGSQVLINGEHGWRLASVHLGTLAEGA